MRGPAGCLTCPVRAISLFSGVGGFELGFDRAGIDTVLQVEQDPVCLSVLERHWPACERLHDVRSLCREREPAGGAAPDGLCATTDQRRWQAGPGLPDGVDLVYGGFPCQDLSVAGQRAGLSGQRSSLWFEFERILSELRPRWCVVENVPGLLSSNSGRDFARILMGLGELGYGWAYRVLDARHFGVPQRRRRVFVVGCLGDQPRAAAVLAVCESCGGHPSARGTEGQDVAFTLAGGSPETSRRIGNAWNTTYLPSLYAAEPDGVRRPLVARESGYRMDLETENFVLSTNGSNVGIGDLPGVIGEQHGGDADYVVANAVRASDGHHGHSSGRGDGADNLVTIHSSAGVRRLTPRECNRLQGFPDDWDRWAADGKEIADSHRYRCMGNAVCVPVAEWLGHRLVAVDAY